MLPWSLLVHSMLSCWTYSNPEIYNYETLTVFDNYNQTSTDVNWSTNYEVNDGEQLTIYPPDIDYWKSDEYQTFSVKSYVESRMLHPNSFPHLAFIFLWMVWYVLTRILEFDLLLEYCLSAFEKAEVDFADAAEDMNKAIQQGLEEQERWMKQGIDPITKLPIEANPDDVANKPSVGANELSVDNGVEMTSTTEVSLDGEEPVVEEVDADTKGGAPPSTIDDRGVSKERRTKSPGHRNPLSSNRRQSGKSSQFGGGGAPPIAVVDEAHSDTGTSFDSATGSPRAGRNSLNGAPRPSNVSRTGSVSRILSVGEEPNREMVNSGLELHYVKHDTSTQECLDMTEVTLSLYPRFIYI